MHLIANNQAAFLNNEQYQQLFFFASQQKKTRIKQLHQHLDRCRSLIGEALIRYGLLQSGYRETAKISFSSRFEKPRLLNLPLEFNIAHSGDWVFCGIDNSQIGVDVEQLKNIDLGIAKHFFSENEKSFITKAGGKLQAIDSFFKIWVLKESYLKATGEGLARALDSFSVIPNGRFNVESEPSENKLLKKYFKMYTLHLEYKFAVCGSHKMFPDEIKCVSIDEVIKTLVLHDRAL